MNKKSFLQIFIILSILYSGGCREYKTTSKVNEDGSIERVIVVSADSSNLLNSSFPIPTGESWEIKKEKDEKGENFTYTAKKVFNNEDQLNSEMGSEERDKLKFRVSLDKTFRWFYSYYTYKETYEAYNVFNIIPFDSAFSKEEIEIYYSDKDSSEIEKKVDEWQEKNMFEEFYFSFVKQTKELNDPLLNESNLLSKKDTLFQIIVSENNDEIDEILESFSAVLGTESIFDLKDQLSAELVAMEKKGDFMWEASGDYMNEVIMPGLIIDTNAPSIEGNKVIWEFKSKRFAYTDYTMWVESRVVNTWAVVISGLAVLLILLGLLVPSLRRRLALKNA